MLAQLLLHEVMFFCSQVGEPLLKDKSRVAIAQDRVHMQ